MSMLKALMKHVLGAAFLILALAATSQAAEERTQAYAVIVGIDHYADKQIKPRTHAEADAVALYELFTSKQYLGITSDNARLLLSKPDPKRKAETATRHNILEALRWAAGAAKRDDLLLFVFIGEGAPLGERACYFAADSTFKNRAKDAVAAAEIEHELEGLKSQHFCAFLDVNFKGFDAGTEPAPEMNMTNFYREFLGKEDKEEDRGPPGRVLFLAHRGLTPSLDLEKHGLFTHVILDALKGAADKEGDEPDGRVTVEEVKRYLERELPLLAKKHGTSREQKDQIPFVLGSHLSRFRITANPPVAATVAKRLEKFSTVAASSSLTGEMIEEGRNLIGKMPKLEAHRSLRRTYEQFAEGKISTEDFLRNREQILNGMKLTRPVALHFANRVIDAAQQVAESYIKELNIGEMVAWSVRGLYQSVDEKMPVDIKDRLEQTKHMKEVELALLLADARERLGRREDLDKHKDVDLALQRMLSHLDPYTTYIDPETLSQFEREIRKNYTGVGIQIRKDSERDMLLVVTPIKGSPAYKAGIKAGDIVTTITRDMDSEGKRLSEPEVISTKGMPLNDAVKKVLGKADTQVKLTIEREGVPDPLEFNITRAYIELETVIGARRKADDSWDYMIDPKNKIAYIRLTGFANNTTRDLIRVLKKLSEQEIKGLILDLRFNPGGLLRASVTISDLFIDDGPIVSIRPRVGQHETHHGKHDPSYLDFDMVCLVNGGSASASEIVSACLQDHNRAVIMGERSYGKGSVQNIQAFDGGQLKMTIASFWRPNGKNLNKNSTNGKDDDVWGVMPDSGYLLKLSRKERDELFEYLHDAEIIVRQDAKPKAAKAEFKDRQMDMALEFLRTKISTASKDPAKKSG